MGLEKVCEPLSFWAFSSPIGPYIEAKYELERCESIQTGVFAATNGGTAKSHSTEIAHTIIGISSAFNIS